MECLICEMLIMRDKRPKYAKHSSRLHPCKTFYLINIVINIVICPFSSLNLDGLFALSFSINITTSHVNFLSLYNDDTKPSKRQVSFILLIFVLKWKIVKRKIHKYFQTFVIFLYQWHSTGMVKLLIFFPCSVGVESSSSFVWKLK